MNHPIGVSPYCIECENRTHWIELLFVDEHNQPFNRIKGEVVDASGAKFKVTLSDSPLVLSALAPGPIKITFENTSWLKETQKRTPRQDSDKDTVPERLKTKGHKGAKKKAVNAVTGDFVQLETDQVLPVQHEANSADVIDLITDNSYVITIKGFNYITLRIGMFFDGTCNNTYSSLWGYQQLVSYYHTWKICRDADIKKQYGQGTPISSYLLQQMKATDFGEEVFELPSKISFYHRIACNDDGHTHFEDVKSSAANELTNVQKMYDFYSEDKFTKETNTFIHKEYITGVGTGNDVIFAPAKEDFVLGTGLGVGDNGIEGKVKQGITQLCASLTGTNTHRKKNLFNTRMLILKENGFDGIRCLEFDVFGFSRGAAAARHFIHHILDAKNKETFQQIESAIKDVNLPLMVGFDWADSDNCCINFAGIMDTVAAVTEPWTLDIGANDDNGDVKLALCKDPLRLRKAIHFTAHPQYEYRSNFGLNLFNKSAQFEEYKLFGCHSDIGGGYYSLESFPYDDYLLPVLEDKKVFGGGMSSLSKQAIVNSMNRILEKEKKIGWLTEDYKQVIQKYTVGKKKDEMWKGSITSKRITTGNLSRLYLRLIYGLAHFNNVPLEDYWEDKDIRIDLGLDEQASVYSLHRYITLPLKLQPFGDAILKDAMSGEVDDFIFGEKFKKYLLVNRMIHHSSDNGMVNKPSYNSDEDYYRYLYECKE